MARMWLAPTWAHCGGNAWIHSALFFFFFYSSNLLKGWVFIAIPRLWDSGAVCFVCASSWKVGSLLSALVLTEHAAFSMGRERPFCPESRYSPSHMMLIQHNHVEINLFSLEKIKKWRCKSSLCVPNLFVRLAGDSLCKVEPSSSCCLKGYVWRKKSDINSSFV